MSRTLSVLCGLCLLVGILASPVQVFAGKDINLTYPCAGGGSRTAVGTYDAVSGQYVLNYTVTNCVVAGVTLNGAIASSGTFKMTSGQSAQVNGSAVYNESAVKGANVGTITCTNTTNGSYNMESGVLNGQVTTNCTVSGNIVMNLNDILIVEYPVY